MDAERYWSIRDSLRHLCHQFSVASMVEVGAFRGDTACALLEDAGLGIEHYWLVDAWQPYTDQCQFVGMNVAALADWERIYLDVVQKVARFGQRATVTRMPSTQAAQAFGDATLDLVFIDANHERGHVMSDILAWLPKVRQGGVLAGHDYDVAGGVNEAVGESFACAAVSFLPDVWFKDNIYAHRTIDGDWRRAIWYHVKA